MMAEARTIRKEALIDSGTPSPNPWDLSPSARMVVYTEGTGRRIGLRRDATRAPIPAPEWHGATATAVAPTQGPRPRRALAYSKPKMVLTTGSTLTLPTK